MDFGDCGDSGPSGSVGGVSAREFVFESSGERSGARGSDLGAGSSVHREAGREDSSNERTSDDLQVAGNKLYLRLSDFVTSNGPNVHVLLAKSDDKTLDQEIVKGDFDSVELGALKGNQGNQNYDLPANVDLSKYQAGVVYCERFHAIFGVARLEEF